MGIVISCIDKWLRSILRKSLQSIDKSKIDSWLPHLTCPWSTISAETIYSKFPIKSSSDFRRVTKLKAKIPVNLLFWLELNALLVYIANYFPKNVCWYYSSRVCLWKDFNCWCLFRETELYHNMVWKNE